ncbi:MAG TPA: hypothetical protein VG943_18735, partial [Caulobacterales bacterium]|nr:hypothetical protein [Caulobacterales bacterium]
MGMGLEDQADWRAVLRGMQTLRELRRETPGEIAAERLNDDVVLQGAAENPDHSEAGRKLAADALLKRGAPRHWRLRVPGFITAKDLERGPRLFFGFGRAVR